MTNGPDSTKHILTQTDAEILILENNQLLRLALTIWDDCPKLKYIIV